MILCPSQIILHILVDQALSCDIFFIDTCTYELFIDINIYKLVSVSNGIVLNLRCTFVEKSVGFNYDCYSADLWAIPTNNFRMLLIYSICLAIRLTPSPTKAHLEQPADQLKSYKRTLLEGVSTSMLLPSISKPNSCLQSAD